jgi:hypothetical protein
MSPSAAKLVALADVFTAGSTRTDRGVGRVLRIGVFPVVFAVTCVMMWLRGRRGRKAEPGVGRAAGGRMRGLAGVTL